MINWGLYLSLSSLFTIQNIACLPNLKESLLPRLFKHSKHFRKNTWFCEEVQFFPRLEDVNLKLVTEGRIIKILFSIISYEFIYHHTYDIAYNLLLSDANLLGNPEPVCVDHSGAHISGRPTAADYGRSSIRSCSSGGSSSSIQWDHSLTAANARGRYQILRIYCQIYLYSTIDKISISKTASKVSNFRAGGYVYSYVGYNLTLYRYSWIL